MGLKRGGSILDRDFDYDNFPLDIKEDWGQDWENNIYGPDKTPRDLRDFSTLREVKFKDGTQRKILSQKSAPPLMSATEAGRKLYNAMWDRIEGGRKIPGLKY